MKQPTKCALREQLALAADEIIRLRESAVVDVWFIRALGFAVGVLLGAAL